MVMCTILRIHQHQLWTYALLVHFGIYNETHTCTSVCLMIRDNESSQAVSWSVGLAMACESQDFIGQKTGRWSLELINGCATSHGSEAIFRPCRRRSSPKVFSCCLTRSHQWGAEWIDRHQRVSPDLEPKTRYPVPSGYPSPMGLKHWFWMVLGTSFFNPVMRL